MSVGLEKDLASVADSLRSEKLTDLLVITDDVGRNIFIESGELWDIPVVGMLNGIWKTGREISHELFVRKILRFLEALDITTAEERFRFTEWLESKGTTERFGETILRLIDKVDDTVNAKIIGRIMAALIKEHINYDKAMPLVHIISKCYAKDLEYLRSFREGTQGNMTEVADALFSAGLLLNLGIDGSFDDPESGGTIYALNEYGKILVEFGWRPNKTTLETFRKTDRGEDLTRFENIDDLLKDLEFHG
ncbi:hypothetical protein MBAV_001449 [Candidatus Magnetobacterium bavaricum]|uniref:Uncharacterized protein n=1 Tax=Candidatus Magnetobacterium bavaricum TaxID=29290 RepID=A0A0F3GWY5_9BACT|nr:hypothetical protein MBAV_001449 [Candidatus Magnetobacterium bavaricum]